MPARIIVRHGTNIGDEFPVEKHAIRIGGAPLCDVQLDDPELAGHAATVRFDQGTYAVFNLGEQAITVGGTVVKQGDRAPWEVGALLSLTSATSLELSIQGDPAPSRRRETLSVDSLPAIPVFDEPIYLEDPDAVGLEDDQFEDRPEVEEHSSSGAGVQLLVIGLCVVLGIAMVIANQLKTEPETPRDTRISRTELFLRLDKTREENQKNQVLDPEFDRVYGLMREAYRAEMGGDRLQAGKHYIQVLRILRGRASSQADHNDTVDAENYDGTEPQDLKFDEQIYGDVFQYISQWAE